MRHDCSTRGRDKKNGRDHAMYCNFCQYDDRINDESYWISKDGTMRAVNIAEG